MDKLFEGYIKRLKSYGWVLSFKHEDEYLFHKRDWHCVLDGPTNTISFYRFDEVKFYEDLNKKFVAPTEEELHWYYENRGIDSRPIE